MHNDRVSCGEFGKSMDPNAPKSTIDIIELACTKGEYTEYEAKELKRIWVELRVRRKQFISF